MRVSIFGSGYVGLVTGACLADAGNDVVCVDIDAGKVARLNAGEIPIHEPGLAELIARNAYSGEAGPPFRSKRGHHSGGCRAGGEAVGGLSSLSVISSMPLGS